MNMGSPRVTIRTHLLYRCCRFTSSPACSTIAI